MDVDSTSGLDESSGASGDTPDDSELYPLTGTVTSGITVGITGADSMSEDDPRLEKAFALIREVIADAKQTAINDFVASLQAKASSSSADAGVKRVTRHPDAEKSKRAPAGSARVLCKRVLGEAGVRGMTTMKIQDHASGEYEKMLSTSAIRNELAVGEKLDPPLYKQVGGVWYLPIFAPAGMRIVSQ